MEAVAPPDPAWERRHPGEPEWWSFDFWAPGANLGGFVGLVFGAAPRVAWYWAALVGSGRPYLLVRDLEVAVPRLPGSRQVRSDGLWADVNCETPFEHWSLGLEAFGVSMDDPSEALGAERGDRAGLGLDLEWEAVAGIVGGDGGYEQPCAVHGEILVGAGRDVETIGLDGHGWRRHGWGDVDWFATPRSWLGGRLHDATPYRAADVGIHDLVTLHRAPLVLEAAARRAVLERRLCRFTAPDGRPGHGWAEWVSPAGDQAG
ncbi:MAG: hypothetical protein M3N68_13745 [Actinomycetota bacterium]|nr:hypothetical protein [Actinomycetota bacterium]